MTTLTRASTALLLPLLAACAAHRGAGPAPAGADLAIRDVGVVDVEGGGILPGRTVLVRGNRIVGVEPTHRVRITPGARVVDGRGKYLIPGLWDMHVHAARAGGRRTSGRSSSPTASPVFERRAASPTVCCTGVQPRESTACWRRASSGRARCWTGIRRSTATGLPFAPPARRAPLSPRCRRSASITSRCTAASRATRSMRWLTRLNDVGW